MGKILFGDPNVWVQKHKNDILPGFLQLTRIHDIDRIDVKFTAVKDSTQPPLTALNLKAAEITQTQWDLIVAWRRARMDTHPFYSDDIAEAVRNQTTGGPLTASEIQQRKYELSQGRYTSERREPRGHTDDYAGPTKGRVHQDPQRVGLKFDDKDFGQTKYPHYFKDVSHLQYIDVYRLLDLFDITDQPIGHAIKKLLAAGCRGAKNQEQDISEAIDTLLRRQAMRKEDSQHVTT